MNPIPQQTLEIRDIRAPIPAETTPLWPWIIAASLLLLFIIIALYLRLRKKAAPPLPSPYEISTRSLRQIAKSMDKADDRAYSLELSRVLRRYIEATLKIHVTDRTTEEFLAAARIGTQLSPTALSFLQEFLQLCDQAKFAAQPLNLNQRQELHSNAKQFIDELERSQQASTQDG